MSVLVTRPTMTASPSAGAAASPPGVGRVVTARGDEEQPRGGHDGQCRPAASVHGGPPLDLGRRRICATTLSAPYRSPERTCQGSRRNRDADGHRCGTSRTARPGGLVDIDVSTPHSPHVTTTTGAGYQGAGPDASRPPRAGPGDDARGRRPGRGRHQDRVPGGQPRARGLPRHDRPRRGGRARARASGPTPGPRRCAGRTGAARRSASSSTTWPTRSPAPSCARSRRSPAATARSCWPAAPTRTSPARARWRRRSSTGGSTG